AIRSGTGVIVGEEVPGIAVVAVVLPHRPPLTIREVRPPLLPGDVLATSFFQATLLCIHVTSPCFVRSFVLVVLAVRLCVAPGPFALRPIVCPPGSSTGKGRQDLGILCTSASVRTNYTISAISSNGARRLACLESQPHWGMMLSNKDSTRSAA